MHYFFQLSKYSKLNKFPDTYLLEIFPIRLNSFYREKLDSLILELFIVHPLTQTKT